jgi:hypothetical protein
LKESIEWHEGKKMENIKNGTPMESKKKLHPGNVEKNLVYLVNGIPMVCSKNIAIMLMIKKME